MMCSLLLALAGCAAHPGDIGLPRPLTLAIAHLPGERISAGYEVGEPVAALHFPQELGGYRDQAWRPTDSAFHWVGEGRGERVERADGRPFDRVTFVIPVDYRALPKSYAPFSPFSDGSFLVHSGQFHACLALPCEPGEPLPIRVLAPGLTIGVEGRRTPGRAMLVSRDEGTNIFVGSLEPVAADGFVAIVDPGLPADLRTHLDRSLPSAIRHFAGIYGPLTVTPELYVSIDDKPEAGGHVSTQGGTLPRQIFMHFDGEGARARLSAQDPYWLDWFFAHEAAHLFQQDQAGSLVGDDGAAWLHEGGADAMAALALVRRGAGERSYVQGRTREAQAACARGVAARPLGQTSAAEDFDLHYQCGLVIWLALDQDLRRAGHDGLNDLGRAFFASVRGGRAWGEPVFLETAGRSGASARLLGQIAAISEGGLADPVGTIAELGRSALLAVDAAGGR